MCSLENVFHFFNIRHSFGVVSRPGDTRQRSCPKIPFEKGIRPHNAVGQRWSVEHVRDLVQRVTVPLKRSRFVCCAVGSFAGDALCVFDEVMIFQQEDHP
jgi:hypothetical protein